MSAGVCPTSKTPAKQFNSIMFTLHQQIMDEPRTPDWTCSEVLQLIREYGNRPALWDPDCDDNKNRMKKQAKWQELAEIFKCSRLEVERKMKILMSQYRRERLKAVRMKKLGLTHRVTWYGYKAFAFMNKQWVRYRNRNNLMNSNTPHYPLIKQENVDVNSHFNSTQDDLLPFLDEDEDSSGQQQQQEDNSTMMAENYENENHVSEMLQNETNKQSENNNISDNNVQVQNSHKDVFKILYDNKDEWALFGELVAHAFRKLADDKMRCIVKHKINTILFEAELESYNISKVEK